MAKDNTYKAHLEKILLQDDRFKDDNDELDGRTVRNYARKMDETLIGYLLEDDKSREKFFLKVNDAYVFKASDFNFFLEQNRLDNSFTQYANQIGLTLDGKYLKDTSDVVLDFPYKDCVLEGGQSTEEGEDNGIEKEDGEYKTIKTKRKEIFYNNIIAKDEIDRLEEPKAFENIVKYTEKGEEPVQKFNRDEQGTITDNLLIKGNNLLALHSLKEEFKGKVKLIYIDPPYNPPSQNNTFTYNNNFNHSAWLTFMRNRLEVSKELLKDDGAYIIAIDENEVHYLGVLLDEMFSEFESHCITIIHNPRGVQGTNFSYTNEYAFFVFPKGKKIINNRIIDEEEIKYSNLRNWGGESRREDAKNCFYPIVVDPESSEILEFGNVCKDDFHPEKREVKKDGKIYVYPVDNSGVERKWRYARNSVEKIKNLLRARIKSGQWDIEIGKNFGQFKTVWMDPKYDANEYGTKIVKNLVPKSQFSFPKSLYNIKDCISAVVGEDKKAIILDYFAGSGTTAHAALDLNQDDNGNRQFIMVEQMEYVKTITAKRIQEVIRRNNEKNQKHKDESFVYLEMAKNNDNAKKAIESCKSLSELTELFDALYKKYFLHYNVNINDFKNRIIKEEAFKKLPLAEQKELFCRMLDNNQMYVNCDEMEDEHFEISQDDINLTKDFYQLKP